MPLTIHILLILLHIAPLLTSRSIRAIVMYNIASILRREGGKIGKRPGGHR